MRRFVRRLITLFRANTAETHLSREIEAHLHLLEDDFVAQGMSREDARYAAKRAFGGVEQAKEHQRDARTFRALAGWPMDLKLGARMLVKSPGLTVVAVTALAVAIGAGAAYLELTRDLLNPTLDVPQAERIVGIRIWNAETRRNEAIAMREFELLRANTRAIEEPGAERPISRHLTTPDGLTGPVRGVEISASAFRLFPAVPVLGRALSDDDERPDAAPVAVIGQGLWTARFNGSPAAVGALIRLGPEAYTVVGVMPDGFGFPINHNLWIPLKDGRPLVSIFGRLAEGASLAAAESEADVLTRDRSASANVRAGVRPYLDSVLAQDRGSLEVAIARAVNVIFILLLCICGANVATLVFARTAMREGEITVRTALGASRGRIGAQLFAEALVLSLLAAGVGLLVAQTVGRWGTQLYERGIGATPFWWDDGLSYPTILYAFALAVFAALIVGVIPALKATGRELQGRLREGASGTSTMKFGGLWTGVIVAQAALTVVFLSMVVSLAWSTYQTQAGGDVIYPRERLLTARVEIERTPGADGDAGTPAYQAALRTIADRLADEPGVANASYSTAMPGTIWEDTEYELQSPELQAMAVASTVTDTQWCQSTGVGERFFDTAGIPFVGGRDFSAAEIRLGAPVAIVDETFVRVVLGGRNPIGVTLRERAVDAEEGRPGPWLSIVGVVKDPSLTKRDGPHDATLFRPAAPGRPVRLLVRTQGAAAPMTQQVYAAALAAHPDVRLVDLKSLSQVAEDAALPERIFLRAFIVVSAIALLLATAGIYALISFTLARRTREIGIRVALGAAPRSIMTGVFSRAFAQIGLGVLAGALPGLVAMDSVAGDTGSMTLAVALAAMLCVCAFVIIVALASCAVPLRRALRVDPMAALRTN